MELVFERTNCAMVAPGVESWTDYSNKAGVGRQGGEAKVDRVAAHFAQLAANVPYLQANFNFGLDTDQGRRADRADQAVHGPGTVRLPDDQHPGPVRRDSVAPPADRRRPDPVRQRHDPDFLAFHEVRHARLPQFYRQAGERILGGYAEVLSEADRTPDLTPAPPAPHHLTVDKR